MTTTELVNQLFEGAAEDPMYRRIVALEAEVARLRALCGHLTEYSKLLEDSENRLAYLGHVHGISVSEDEVKRGAELRRMIAEVRYV